ncbi:hypothetical protein QBC47DRAFT_26231 [Echria macrotheca]|uniref:Uncharacterized protein n=1 Tax=Echria macrotheca TaxID=438768 RepID=A0AAJ0BN25_9PEZI|nr:hypothetical protein QBC47DRAFT_26231 [Echria macrotheca]
MMVPYREYPRIRRLKFAMSSNSTSTSGPGTEPQSSTTSTNSPTTAVPPPTTSSSSSSSSSSTPTPPPTTSEPPPPPPTTSSSSSHSSSSSSSSSTTPTPPASTTIITTDGGGSTITTVQTITAPPPANTGDAVTSGPATATSGGSAISPSDSSNPGLGNAGKIAVAVVVPIAAVALLVLAGIFFWRKRKQRKDAEEQRRKEVEEYGYNPNADPTIPAVAAAGPYEMKEDGSSGYRGWGSTTLAGSTGRKASTTMSGGAAAYSDTTSPTRGGVSDTRSGEPLMDRGSPTPEGEILGAMGPAAGSNRADVRRGPSNASSSYSQAARSDGSGDAPIGAAYGGTQYDQYGGGNPYGDVNRPGQGTAELAGQPVIRDVTARRNTRIENPAHYPQQSAGISQNF